MAKKHVSARLDDESIEVIQKIQSDFLEEKGVKISQADAIALALRYYAKQDFDNASNWRDKDAAEL